MEAAVQVEELTSGASGRLIPVYRNLRQSILSYQFLRRFLLLFYSLFLWILLLLPRRHRLSSASSPPSSPKTSSSSIRCRKLICRRDEEDTLRRRALAEAVEMVTDDIADDDMNSRFQWSTSLFFGDRQNALFCRSWFPVSGDLSIASDDIVGDDS